MKSVGGPWKISTSDFFLSVPVGQQLNEVSALLKLKHKSLVRRVQESYIHLLLLRKLSFCDQLLTRQQHQDIVRSSNLTVAVSLSQTGIYKPLTFLLSVDKNSSRSYQTVSARGLNLNGIIDPESNLLLQLAREQAIKNTISFSTHKCMNRIVSLYLKDIWIKFYHENMRRESYFISSMKKIWQA